MNSHARFAAHTAARMGLSFRSLDGDDCYLFEVSDGVRKAAFPVGYATPYALNPAHAYSLARDKAFATRVLAEAGLPTIPGEVFFVNERQRAYRSPGREKADALAWAEAARFPIFCKPNQGSKGEYAEIVADAAGFAEYMARVGAHYDVILAQPVIEGVEHRVLVLHGEALCAYRKTPPAFVGDGASSVRALIEAARGGWKAAALSQPLETMQARGADGALLALDDVPAKGSTFVLDGRANRSAGGGAAEIVDQPRGTLGQIACAAAKALGLAFAGVDLFDVSPAKDGSAAIIIEVNANPAMETLEAQGRFDLIEAVWRANFEAALR